MTKVVVANRLERDGKTFKGGDVVDVSPGEAADLLYRGSARAYVEPKPEVQAVKGVK